MLKNLPFQPSSHLTNLSTRGPSQTYEGTPYEVATPHAGKGMTSPHRKGSRQA
ncbi:hypothetical protein QJS04_geneDACA011741 [Acorus gramineus]|uniref:Uncharacterized protein n=1 Tax=Acorus gramineus TaxID=55184 RepID=A0AAV9BGB2_ACOGR|nr:hypothetical protein QJS04_geneDACA011741 [Acorus gramineus]